MNYPLIAKEFYSTPWALLPSKLDEIRAFIERKIAGDVGANYTPPPHRERLTTSSGETAIIMVHGVLSQRMNLLTATSGGTSTEKLAADIAQAVNDPAVRRIVLHVDSSGGSVHGIVEAAAVIRDARERKPIFAVADSTAASAAFWLASQATEFSVTPGGATGSLGVIVVHRDFSEAERMEGVRSTFITSSRFKSEGNSSNPLSDEARANVQAMVNEYHAAFVGDVAKGRGLTPAYIEKHFGEGRMMLARQALAVKAVDRIETFAELLRRVEGRRPASARGVAARVAEVDAIAARVAAETRRDQAKPAAPSRALPPLRGRTPAEQLAEVDAIASRVAVGW